MVRLTLKQCSYLAAVAKHGSIAEAARTLNMSQPAVAQALDPVRNLIIAASGRWLVRTTAGHQTCRQYKRYSFCYKSQDAHEFPPPG